MRLVVLLVLLLSCLPAWGTLVPSQRCWLPDGPYAPTADLATKCPPQQSGGSAASISTTGWTADVDTTGSTGTLYVYVSASSTPPSRKTHISGSGAIFSDSNTVTTSGHQDVTVTGSYTAGAAYYTHLLHVRDGRPSNRVTVAVTIPTGGGGGTTVEGYFWGTSGSDFNAGTSHAARFASLGPVVALSGVASGTDVWGLAGSTHTVTSNGKFATKWSGTEGDPVIVGCYYLDSSTPTACWEGASGDTLDLTLPNAATENTLGSNTLPNIKGGNITDACLAAKNCDWQYPIANECSSGHDHIARVRHNYVHVIGMKVEESTCRGLDVSPGTVTDRDGALLGFRLRHSIIEQTGAQGLLMYSGMKYSLAQDSIGRFMGECTKSRYHGGTYPTGSSASLAAGGPGCQQGGSAWIYQSSIRAFSGFDNNRLFASWTEVFHCLRSSHILMRKGIGGNVARAGVYRDVCGDTIVEQNMLWGPNGNVGFGAGTYSDTFGGSPDSNAEFNQYTSTMAPTNQLVRANLFVGLGSCAMLNMSNAAVSGGEKTGGKFYHNSCIATRSQAIVAGTNLTASANLGFDIRNNRFSDPTATGSGVCQPSGANDTNSDYNVHAKQLVAGCRGSNDYASGAASDTLLTLPVGTSASPNTTNINAWRAVSYLAPPDPEDARPTSGIHTGTRLNNVQCISDADYAEWAKILVDMTSPPTESVWKMCAAEYYDGALIANTPVVGGLDN